MTFTHKATIHHNPMIFLNSPEGTFHSTTSCCCICVCPSLHSYKFVDQGGFARIGNTKHCNLTTAIDLLDIYGLTKVTDMQATLSTAWSVTSKGDFCLMSAKTRWQYEEHLGCWSWSILSPPHRLRQLQLQNHVPAKKDQNLRPFDALWNLIFHWWWHHLQLHDPEHCQWRLYRHGCYII